VFLSSLSLYLSLSLSALLLRHAASPLSGMAWWARIGVGGSVMAGACGACCGKCYSGISTEKPKPSK
jgi:hypothetical protein